MYELPPLQALAPRSDDQVLNVGIVGAGIGGLTAAIALAESGHHVEIFEKSSFLKEAGAAITAPPNFSRILRFYGFDFRKAGATDAGDVLYYHNKSGQPTNVVPVGDYEAKFSAPWYYFHRVDLHNQLQTMVLGDPEAGSHKKRSIIRLGVTVQNIDLDGSITLQDDTVIKKDLVVVADGIRSTFTSKIIGKAVKSEHYMSMLRFLVPSRTVLDNPETSGIFKEGLTKLRIVLGQNKSMAMYGCRNGELQNIGILFDPSLSVDENGEPLEASDVLVKVTEDFHSTFREICIGATGIGRWNLYKRSPLSKFARGKVVVVGDAAHPMAPVRSQGASMAGEDAAALGILLSRVKSTSEVEERLALYNQLRVKRVAGVQTISTMHQWDSSRLSKEEASYFDERCPETPADLDNFILANNVIGDAWALLNQSKNLL
ncbi:hypothetical protein EDB81DRAFT_768925 [Dactylonectria macrodidyma]|uniref:FAD-binding domain-containing protein n=1 Tax=Dactylonectria macrodidyma TaxID=307937 RepID=A0A9P9D0L1_9HYPO|nr:hypothetical protein EDB81DRAFT_768925 [Dactylonectria macrodidyma]